MNSVCVCVCMCGYGMAGGCFTDAVVHSSRNYRQENATEPHQLPKNAMASWGAVILRFHGVFYLCSR